MPLPDALTHPAALAVLTVVMLAALQYQRTLSWREYATIHRLKVAVFPALDSRWPHFVHRKGPPEASSEYLRTVDAGVRETWQCLVDAGGSPHLLSSVKRRPETTGEYSAAHVVWTHDDGTQTEAYLFRSAGGGTDVYAHRETSVADPDGHLTDGQTNADPRGVVTAALEG